MLLEWLEVRQGAEGRIMPSTASPLSLSLSRSHTYTESASVVLEKERKRHSSHLWGSRINSDGEVWGGLAGSAVQYRHIPASNHVLCRRASGLPSTPAVTWPPPPQRETTREPPPRFLRRCWPTTMCAAAAFCPACETMSGRTMLVARGRHQGVVDYEICRRRFWVRGVAAPADRPNRFFPTLARL